MMPNTARDATNRDDLRERILVGLQDPSMPSSLTQALQSLLAAMEYKDEALIHASVHEGLSALQQSLNEAIGKRLGWPERVRMRCRRIWDELRDHPGENWD